MTITLGTNIPSYNARVSLNSVTDMLAQTMEKLSTGSKLNRAGDDAAGLVISQNMEALIKGSKQAQANIQNATSFLTIAEDGMVSIGDHFQRINDLLVNMANDTNDINSRTAAVNEIIERLDEINRLADSTNFNGRKMLDGKTGRIVVQLGADDTKESYLDISSALTDCHIFENALNAQLPDNLNPYKYDEIKGKSADGNTDVSIKGDSNGALYKGTFNGGTVYYTTKPTGDVPNPSYYALETDEDGNSNMVLYEYDETTKVHTKSTATSVDPKTLAYVNTSFEPTNENCRSYMKIVQDAIAELSTRRGLLGAYENRMDSSFNSMSTRIESLEEAKSVYTDTDIAQEATNMTSQQILQQVNVSILSAANQTSQLALALLG